MEKDQYNNVDKKIKTEDQPSKGGAPGQVLPTKDDKLEIVSADPEEKKEQHSHSSWPQGDNETLGTP